MRKKKLLSFLALLLTLVTQGAWAETEVTISTNVEGQTTYVSGDVTYNDSVTGVTLPSGAELTVGGTTTLEPTVIPANATDKTVTWATSDASVATVAANGVVTARGIGTATITATATNGTDDTSDDKTATCTVTVKSALSTDASGAYLIAGKADWDSFVSEVNAGCTFSGDTVKMTADISGATTMVGTNETYSFQGIFDGQGHTLNVNITNNSAPPAPFLYIKNATIRNLVVTGSITSTQIHVSGLVKSTYGNILIENCNVAATISGAEYMGGFIGHSLLANITLRGCVFSGTLSPTGSYNIGGFIGWGGNDAHKFTIADCLFNGEVTSTSTLFHPVGCYNTPTQQDRTITNTYYTLAAQNMDESNYAKSFVNGLDANSRGKMARSITAGDDVTSLAISGDATEYNVSGITTYAKGIKYNGVYYAGNGDEVSLTLSHADKDGYTFSEYTASDGTLSGSTLTMPDADVTISATYTENTATLTDGDDVASALDTWRGKTCTVTYTRSFTNGKPSTVCLPFAYTPKTGETFYAFTDIEKVGNDYIATMTEPGTSPLTANTPYLFMPVGDADFSGTYAIPNDLTAGTTTPNGSDWTFVGTYTEQKWTEAPTGIYGFSAQDVAADGISQGQFVKVGAYVRIKPMRAYLKYKDGEENYAGARALAPRRAVEELPETITVRLVSATGEVNSIGTLHTRTGEVTTDGWYTLDGKRLSAQPTQKGIYVNNGKKVTIK